MTSINKRLKIKFDKSLIKFDKSLQKLISFYLKFDLKHLNNLETPGVRECNLFKFNLNFILS